MEILLHTDLINKRIDEIEGWISLVDLELPQIGVEGSARSELGNHHEKHAGRGRRFLGIDTATIENDPEQLDQIGVIELTHGRDLVDDVDDVERLVFVVTGTIVVARIQTLDGDGDLASG